MRIICFSRPLKFVILLSLITYSVCGSDAIKLEQIYKSHMFAPNTVNHLYPMNDGRYYTVIENFQAIIQSDYQTGELRDTVFSLDKAAVPELTQITDYSFSKDESVMLITGEQHAIYRHSFSSEYYVFERNYNRLTPVFDEGDQQLATISPDGEMVSFIYENNLFIKDIESNNIAEITTDGERNSIICGKPDWVYEEEFTMTTGHYWSPDSRKIAFYRFDERRVKEFNMTFYFDLYPDWYKYKYPKAGEDNALVEIYVYDLVKGTITKMETGDSKERYIPRIRWLPNSQELCVIELNRLQNEAKVG